MKTVLVVFALLVGLAGLTACSVNNADGKAVPFSGRVTAIRPNGYSVNSDRPDVFDTAMLLLDEPADAKGQEITIVLNEQKNSPRFRTVGSVVRFALPQEEAQRYLDMRKQNPSLAFVYASFVQDASK
jgi:hypothetical protein